MRIPFKVLIALLFADLFGGVSVAQVNSPYSQFGVGRLRDQAFSASRAMGGFSVAWRNFENINFLNPASYSSFHQVIDTANNTPPFKVTSLETAIYTDAITAKSLTGSAQTANASLGYLAFGFPLPRIGGLSLGLIPYSNVDYHITSTDTTDQNVGTKGFINIGTGNLYRVYAGLAAKKKGLSVGANFYYLFGTLDNSAVLWFPDQTNSFGTRTQVIHTPSGLGWNGGVQYKAEIDTNLSLILGGTFELATSIKVTTDSLTDRVLVLDEEQFTHLDSLTGILGATNALEMPQTFGIGAALKGSAWMTGVDFTYKRWSTTTDLLAGTALSDAWRFAFAFEYGIPNQLDRELNILQKSRYRAGLHFGRQYLQLNGAPVSDFGITFGIGIPRPQRNAFDESTSRLVSSVDLSFDFGSAGGIGENLVSENYFRFTLGLNLNNNYWFFKTKLD